MASPDNFSHAATVLPVQDVQQSIQFYTEKLSFELTFSWGTPITYAVLKKGGVSVHLSERADGQRPSAAHCAMYIFVYDLEQIYQHCRENGVPVKNAPAERDYHMSDFDIEDPDGHIITFGKGN